MALAIGPLRTRRAAVFRPAPARPELLPAPDADAWLDDVVVAEC
jgi:hypothetical protein